MSLELLTNQSSGLRFTLLYAWCAGSAGGESRQSFCYSSSQHLVLRVLAAADRTDSSLQKLHKIALSKGFKNFHWAVLTDWRQQQRAEQMFVCDFVNCEAVCVFSLRSYTFCHFFCVWSIFSSACSSCFYFILICLLTSSSVTSPRPLLCTLFISAGHRERTETSRGEDVSALIPLRHIGVWSYRRAGLESRPPSLAFSPRSPGCRSPVSPGFEWLGWEWDVSVCVRRATPASINHKTPALRLEDTHTHTVVYTCKDNNINVLAH